MNYIFTMPADEWDERQPNKRAILSLIKKHMSMVPRLQKLRQYYEGHHAIEDDADKAIKLVCNHAKDICDTSSAYFLSNPIAYRSKADITKLTDALDTADADEVDGDNALDLAIYGRAYEYIYTREDETDLVCKSLSPESTFVVYDDSIEQRELFAVYYYVRKDDTDQHIDVYVATVLTEHYKYVLNIEDIEGPQSDLEPPVEHFKGEIPIIEYLNNKAGIGDFELQIPLIDAYNSLMSDRMQDKEQFIDAILAIYGTLLSDEDYEDENGNKGGAAAMAKLKRDKLVEFPEGTKAEYLTRTFDENGVEILKKAIEQDIHKFSNIPCMTDESFGGNVSGVAMEFKLLGMENITKIKTRYYKRGLKKRLRIFGNWLANKAISVDVAQVTPMFTRGMPKNNLEISQIVDNLWGKVSQKTLLAQIPFVDDPDDEIKSVQKEQQEAVEQQQKLFGGLPNTPPELENEPEEEPEETGEEEPEEEDEKLKKPENE
jgi:SPP1 family phage portal protein